MGEDVLSMLQRNIGGSGLRKLAKEKEAVESRLAQIEKEHANMLKELENYRLGNKGCLRTHRAHSSHWTVPRA